jgi:hypothetical protein
MQEKQYILTVSCVAFSSQLFMPLDHGPAAPLAAWPGQKMMRTSIAETWKNLTPFGRLLIGFISIFLILCIAVSCFSALMLLLLPVPTLTPPAAPAFTLSPAPDQQPSFTPLPGPSLTPLPTRRGYASSTPPIYVVTPTNTSFRFLIPSVTPTFTRIPRNKSVCTCAYDRYDCSDFLKEKQAQACFNFCFSQGAGDLHHLDEDGNGLACDSLP